MSTAKAVAEYLTRAPDLLVVDQSSVAAALNTDRRTLLRALRFEHASVRGLIDQERQRRCMATLQANKHTCARRLAQRCGYSTMDSMYRAFKRWTGLTLKQYRSAA